MSASFKCNLSPVWIITARFLNHLSDRSLSRPLSKVLMDDLELSPLAYLAM